MDSDDPSKLAPMARWAIALAFVAAGIFPILAAFDIGPLQQEDIHGPPWIGAVAGGIFCLGGIALLGPELPWLGRLVPYLGVILVAGFASLANWVAFGPGPRECSGGLSILGFGWDGMRPDLECRIAFGIGATMLNGMLLWTLGASLARSFGPNLAFEWIEKAGRGLFFLALAPFLLILVVTALGRGLLDSFREWRRTGVWPKNEAFRQRMRLRKRAKPQGRLP